MHACVQVTDSIKHLHIIQDLKNLTRHRAPMTPWPNKAGACSPPWLAHTEGFDPPLYGDNIRAKAQQAAAMNIELIEQMLFPSKCVKNLCPYQM